MVIHLKNAPICPICKKVLDGALSVEKPDAPIMPKKDDILMCCNCLNFLFYDSDCNLHLISPEKMLALPDEVRMLLIRMRADMDNLKEKAHAKN